MSATIDPLDVVPVEPEQWTHPPFAGEVADGFVWGRGAIDSKLTTAVGLQVLRLCQRLNLPLKRDLVVVAAADEELGATYGVQWLAQNHPEVFDAEYGINEAGGFALLVDGRPLYTCQVGEKGGANLDIVAHGRPGHSSVPHDENPIFYLGQILSQMAGGKMPHRLPNSVQAFFEAAAASPSCRIAVGSVGSGAAARGASAIAHRRTHALDVRRHAAQYMRPHHFRGRAQTQCHSLDGNGAIEWPDPARGERGRIRKRSA